eukprot:NODE_2263_length_611_cov_40.702479_g2213_i0.p1 GENE.NODE_2263_length_611_cov_40.702479_g2213_i0~~NODE_2263_length_611_cov_40.702479_g2213_i0.p1  ORF type:complete len:100 (-),score=4.22 NODE_2263_length_611_cov_40.702479_g2213_i0:154-453(-)
MILHSSGSTSCRFLGSFAEGKEVGALRPGDGAPLTEKNHCLIVTVVVLLTEGYSYHLAVGHRPTRPQRNIQEFFIFCNRCTRARAGEEGTDDRNHCLLL